MLFFFKLTFLNIEKVFQYDHRLICVKTSQHSQSIFLYNLRMNHKLCAGSVMAKSFRLLMSMLSLKKFYLHTLDTINFNRS